jgi:hypothetical protein
MDQFFLIPRAFIPAFRHLSEIYCVAAVALSFFRGSPCDFYGIFAFLSRRYPVC